MYPAHGLSDPFTWPDSGFDPAATGAATDNASFITTSGILPESEYPQFSSHPAANYDRPGGPFAPHSGDHYVYSNIADVA
jgi:hypothetical protein